MSEYRTHFCSELTINDLNKEVVLSGWVDTIRDHGNLIFIDIRDNYGITQCVLDSSHSNFKKISSISIESVLTVKGLVTKRSQETITRSRCWHNPFSIGRMDIVFFI